jgi:L-asparaginase/Glu-tRNA(Gln) amidotransferase subunit D
MAMSRQERINSQKKQYRIDSVKQAFKDDVSITPKSISLLKDSTGGTISNAVDDTTASQSEKDDVATLANKVNEILLSLKTVGIIQ